MSLRSNSQNFFHFRLTLDDEEGRNGCYVPNPEGGFPFNTKVWFSAQTTQTPILGWFIHQWQWWVAECDWDKVNKGFCETFPAHREKTQMFITKHTICFLWTLPNCVHWIFSGALTAAAAAVGDEVAFTGVQIHLLLSLQAKCDQDIPLWYSTMFRRVNS